MWPNRSRPGFRRPRPSLQVKLVAAALCLLAAGAAVIVTVGAGALRGQLIRQSGGQLRAYADELTSHSFQVLGTARGAPVATVPFDATGARVPGTASMSGAARAAAAADGPGTMVDVAANGKFSFELRGPSGQLLLSVGPGTRPGLALPTPFAPVPARTGVLHTVGDYLVIAEPVHVSARRLVFAYGADDFAVTGGTQAGPVGTLVVGMQLAGIGQTARRLTLLAAAVSAAVILIGGGLLWAVIRLSLRPVIRAAQTADAITGPGPASGLSSGQAAWPDGRLAGSLPAALSHLEARFAASDEAEAAARSETDRLSQRVESVSGALRRPVSLLHGVAEYWLAGHWAHRDRRGAADADHAVDQVATEAARAEALLKDLD